LVSSGSKNETSSKRPGKKMPAGVADAPEEPAPQKPKPKPAEVEAEPAETPDPAQILADLEQRKFVIANDNELNALIESLGENGDVVTKLSFAGSKISPAGLQRLESFPKLVELDASTLGFTSSGWEVLAKLEFLERLNVSDSSISDDGLANVAGLHTLKDLNLSNTEQVSDRGHESLAALANLERLNISRNSKIKGSGFASIRKRGSLPNLRELVANGSHFGDDGMGGLPGLGSLEALEIDNCGVQNGDLQAFRKCEGIKRLLLGGNVTIDDVGMKELSHLKLLEYLELRHLPKVSDRGLSFIKGAKQLGFVYVDGTAVTSKGVAALKKLIPKVKIRFQNEVIE